MLHIRLFLLSHFFTFFWFCFVSLYIGYVFCKLCFLILCCVFLQLCLYILTRSVRKESSQLILKKVTYLEQWYLSPLQSTPLGTSHTYPSVPSTFQNSLKSPFFRNRHQLPRRILLNLVCGLKSPPFQWQFQFREKPEVTGSQIWAVGGLTDLGDAMFYRKSLHKS